MYIRKVVQTVACLVLPPAQFRLYYALCVYPLPKAVAHADKLLVVLIVIDRSIELKNLGITGYIQGVPGGKDLTSGECSLGQTIPI